MPVKSRAYPLFKYSKTHYRHPDGSGFSGDSPELNLEKRFASGGAERIVYTNRRGYTNPCNHIKLREKLITRTFTGKSTVGFNGGYLTTYVNETWASSSTPFYPIVFLDPSLSDFRRKFIGSGAANLATFIGEIVEVKELLKSSLTLLPSILRGIGLLVFQGVKRKAPSLGSLFLTLKFGIEPLIKDLKSLFEVGTTLNARIKRLESLSFKAVRVRFSGSYAGRSESSPIMYNHCTHRVYSNYSVKQSASCLASLLLPAMVVRTLSVPLSAEFLGLEATAANAWELLPFSFLLDYIGNFSQVIDDYSTTMLDVSIKLWDFCRSCKVTATGEAVVVRDPILGGALEGATHHVTNVIHYVREPFLANQFQTFSFKDTNDYQLAIVGSLVSQR